VPQHSMQGLHTHTHTHEHKERKTNACTLVYIYFSIFWLCKYISQGKGVENRIARKKKQTNKQII
jgi:hypothetical protein